MKILFVYPDINVKGGSKSFHFGLGHISSFLQSHGYETDWLYMFGEYDPYVLNAKIKSFKPDVIAFTSTTSQYKYVKQALRDIPENSAFTICGGSHVTMNPDVLAITRGLDAICRGEGEYPMLELCKALEKQAPVEEVPGLWVKRDGNIIKSRSPQFIQNLNTLPFPDRGNNYQEVIDSEFNTALFMFSRGCPYVCTFCSNHTLRKVQSGKYVRFRSVENALAEIDEVVNKYRVKSLYFNDDVFTLDKAYALEFCKQYKEKFSFPFQINARVEGIDEEMAKALADAGCVRMNFGVECGHEEFRKKYLKRNMPNKKIEEAFEIAKNAGIHTKSWNIVGFPHETKEIFEETINLNTRLRPNSLVIYIFEPYPGTDLMEICKRDNLLDDGYLDFDFKARTESVLNMPEFPKTEIQKCYKNFGFNVYKTVSLKKALFHKIYYSDYGDIILHLLSPLKMIFRKLTMDI